MFAGFSAFMLSKMGYYTEPLQKMQVLFLNFLKFFLEIF